MKSVLPFGAFTLFLIIACTPDAPAKASSAEVPTRITVTDSLGRRISLQRPAARIAALSPGFIESLFAVGCGDRVVLRDPWSDYPEVARSLPATDGVNLSVANIAGFSPDLVILYFKDDRNVEAFSQIGIPVVVFDPKTYADVADMVQKISVLCGKPSEGEKVAREMRRMAGEISPTPVSKRVSVFIEVDGTDLSRPWTAGRGSFIDEIVSLSGGRNVMGNLDTPYAQITAEEIIRSDPDYVLLLSAGRREAVEKTRMFKDRPGYGAMKAVRANRIIADIDRDTLTRVGPRLLDGLIQMRSELAALPEHQ